MRVGRIEIVTHVVWTFIYKHETPMEKKRLGFLENKKKSRIVCRCEKKYTSLGHMDNKVVYVCTSDKTPQKHTF